jgi:mono/diheme cytochrome c family protein
MKKNKHLLLWSSAGVFALLLVAAVTENFGREWRNAQKASASAEGPIDVRLRQIVNPGLNVSDRCISCHVGMGPGEQGIAGDPVVAAHKYVVHSPAEFGCTVCHGGQGLATTRADAHGDVQFWPQPMLPRKYSYVGCGTCHTPLNVPNLASLEKSRGAFERLDCLACHRVDGRGGTIRPNGGGMEGPELSEVAIRGYDAGWYEKHLQKNAESAQGPWKHSFGAISDSDRAALAGRDFLQLASDDFITETIKQGRPGCKMPSWAHEAGLKPEGIRRVVAYLRELGGNVAFTSDANPARWVKGNAAAGAKLFAANCAGCHGQKGEGGEGPALNNKTLLATATDRFLLETIGRGRRGTAMKGFLDPSLAQRTLTATEVESIVTFIRTWEAK